jgi:nitroreductase
VELDKAILTRRSVRKFTDHYVTDTELKQILEAARFAPSWANTQSWEFIIVRDREIIREVTETYSATNPARECSFNASALIVACARSRVSGYKGGEARTKFSEWFMFDLGLAVQNLCLRAHELGLGTVVVGSMDHNACAKVLQVPGTCEVVAVLPVGKPESKGITVPARKELKEFIFLDKYGERFTALY